MWAILVKIALAIFGAFRPQGPSREAQQAARAASAETKLAIEVNDNAQVTKAAAAARAVDAALLRDPDSLRAPDRYSRD